MKNIDPQKVLSLVDNLLSVMKDSRLDSESLHELSKCVYHLLLVTPDNKEKEEKTVVIKDNKEEVRNIWLHSTIEEIKAVNNSQIHFIKVLRTFFNLPLKETKTLSESGCAIGSYIGALSKDRARALLASCPSHIIISMKVT